MKHTFDTSTSIRRYLECPFKYKMHHVDQYNHETDALGWKPKTYLSLGVLIHQALLKIQRDEDWTEVIPDSEYVLLPTPDANDDYRDMVMKLRAMMTSFLKCQDEFGFPHKLEYEAREIQLKCYLEDPNTKDVFELRGSLDGIYRFKDELWLIDDKTRSRTPPKDEFRLDPQQMLYILLAAMNDIKLKGYMIRLWRVPSLRKSKRNNETDEQLYERMCNDIYHITKRQLRGKSKAKEIPYFLEYVYPINKEQLFEFHDNTLLPVLQQIKQGVYYRNRDACVGKYGNCEWYNYCHGYTPLDKLEKKEHEHPELEGVYK